MTLFNRNHISDEVRMLYAAPSFSFPMVKSFSVKEPKDLRLLLLEQENPAVLFFPNASVFEEMGKWTEILAQSKFVLLGGPKEESNLKRLNSFLEKKVFSPVAKNINGSQIVSDEKETFSMYRLLQEQGFTMIQVQVG